MQVKYQEYVRSMPPQCTPVEVLNPNNVNPARVRAGEVPGVRAQHAAAVHADGTARVLQAHRQGGPRRACAPGFQHVQAAQAVRAQGLVWDFMSEPLSPRDPRQDGTWRSLCSRLLSMYSPHGL